MGEKSRPHAGSLAYYPRVRALKETPSFKTFPKNVSKPKPMNFFGYKAGMMHLIAKDLHQKSVTFGQDVSVPTTVVECPPLKVFGVRAYGKSPYGYRVLTEVTSEKIDRHLLRRMHSFKKRSAKQREGKAGKEKKSAAGEQEKKYKTLEDLEKLKSEIAFVRLLVHTQPFETTIGKKKPDVSEVAISGSVEEQLAIAKQRLGSDLKVSDVFEQGQFVDVKAVTKGKGMEGPVKRFGVKQQRPKMKKRRIVGSIGPWNPSTVMWTVARPGQMGYHTRTEYNKRILVLGNGEKWVAKGYGFPYYGDIRNDFLVLSGSLPGAPKRCIALRLPVRPFDENIFKLAEPSHYSIAKQKGAATEEETFKAQKIKLAKEEKKEVKSVEEELKEAAKKAEK